MSVARATATQTVQIGVEATPGTAVPADKRLQGIVIERPSVEGEIDMVTPEGSKFPTLQVMDREWTTMALSGRPTFDEIVYILASLVSEPTITKDDTDDAWSWVFAPESFDIDDDLVTFTIERGDSSVATRVTRAQATAMTIDITASSITFSGTLIAHLLQTDSVTMTASPDTLPLIPLLRNMFSIYLDDELVDIGDTKFLGTFAATISIGDVRNPFWPIDADLDSFAGMVDTAQTATLTLQMMANAAGMGPFANLRSGQTAFIRVATDDEKTPVIDGDTHYGFQLDWAGKINQVPDLSDLDGAEVVQYQFHAVPELDNGKAYEFTVTNSIEELASSS